MPPPVIAQYVGMGSYTPGDSCDQARLLRKHHSFSHGDGWPYPIRYQPIGHSYCTTVQNTRLAC